MAEIPLDWHMLFFANEESNCIGKKLGLAFFCADKFLFTHCFAEAVKQETAAFVADASPKVVPKSYQRDGQPHKTENELTNDR